jgi:hypothetical protein
MPDSKIRVLLILGTKSVAEHIAAILDGAPVQSRFEVVHCPSFSNWLETLSTGEFHSIVYIEPNEQDGAVEQLIAIRQRVLMTPLCVITRAEGSVSVDLIRAGADDLLSSKELTALKLSRSILVAIERKKREIKELDATSNTVFDDDSDALAIKREIDEIIAIVGEKSLPVTRKAYSVTDFRDQESERFEEFVSIYAGLIDQALNESSHKTQESYRDSLAVFADKLGMCNLGPRDIIDIHKEVIARKTREANRTKMQAYIGEGRLLLVQLMGNVLSFYRSFFWGCRVLAANAKKGAAKKVENKFDSSGKIRPIR